MLEFFASPITRNLVVYGVFLIAQNKGTDRDILIYFVTRRSEPVWPRDVSNYRH
jgi:hypothetical protein